MKFSLAIEKKNRGNIGTVEGHNNRLHPTASQLPVDAWITPQGHRVVVPLDCALLAKSKALAQRKDAVLAVELIIQVGNQTDWRTMPTENHPHGRRKPGAAKRLNAIMAGVKQAAFAEFGQDRIISIDLHTDESSPHAHIVFAPIVEGKLQAKQWLNGAASCSALRERLHAHVTQHIECSYEKGAPGGAAHDASKAAGGANGPKPSSKSPGLLGRAMNAFNSIAEIKQLKKAIEDLNQQLQTMFSRLKRAEKVAKDEAARREKAEKKAAESDLAERKARREIVVLERKLNGLAPKIEPVKPAPAPSDGLLPAQKPGKAARPT